MKINYIK